ncbi:hypothetical protein [Puniceibacterium sediminis]|uniref:Transferrin-binding protein B C-lobe/N-lobe beta barrel domain-containing protein n=1 Tax=Puniceibacterium sediminis TaxID=1608407 RepID=A0A238ZSH2_9RHOB|nr:hypothetical protein [Puniceibacterium sediminis]SNR86367.1 hypothetical protein SAMN06265370_1409 [Puniceibacterium sediminis]
MNFHIIPMICVASLAFLAGCGGSSSSSTDEGAVVVTPPTYAELTQDLTDLETKYSGAARATSVDINTAANATYTGAIAGDLGGSGLAGDLTIAADFGANTASVTATNFMHETDGAYAGTLTDTGGVIAPTAPGVNTQISATLTGDLTNGGNTFASNIGLDGDFVTDGTDPVAGITGTAFGTLGAAIFDGDFAAEK